MEFYDIQRQMLADVIAAVGQPITYKGNTINAVVSALELSNDPGEGGLMETLVTQVVFPLSAVSVAPKTGESVLIGTQKARIGRVSKDEVSYELVCGTASR